MQRLDARVRVAWVVGAVGTALLVGGVVTTALALGAAEFVPVGLAVGLLVLALGAVHAVYRYRRWGFELEPDALYIERGVLTRVRTVVPFVRVQHVDARQSPVERALGLSSVVVYTAGSRGGDVSIPGLTPDRADALQDRLRELAIETDPEDAV
jgi:membrane protein YdbS with pleckstrin-like domain